MDGLVTAIEPQRRRGSSRLNVFLDGQFAFSLEQDLAALVRVGEPLSSSRTVELLRDDERARALGAAAAFLAHRPRSEREVRDRLRRGEVPEPIAEQVIERLKELKLLDDAEFARYWIEQRQTHRPRGARLLRQELQLKGIDRELSTQVLDEAAEEDDPVDAACRAAERRARAERAADAREFERRLGPFLLRRGFDYETVRSACRRLWAERQAAQ